MSNKGQTTTLEERVTIAERTVAGQSSRENVEEQLLDKQTLWTP